MLARQGPHQVAQNSTTTTFFPLVASRLTGSPLTHSLICRSAAFSPNSAAVSEEKAARIAPIAVTHVSFIFIRVLCLRYRLESNALVLVAANEIEHDKLTHRLHPFSSHSFQVRRAASGRT